MLLGVSATFFTSSPPPPAAGFRTLAALGQVVFSVPSEISPQVLVSAFSVSNDPLLIRPSYFVNMWVVPDPSKRTTGWIAVSALQPVPVSLSPASVIWLHLVISPTKI